MGAAPISFVCPVARRNQRFDSVGYALATGMSRQRVSVRSFYSYPEGHETIVRTGRVRAGQGNRGVLPEKDYGSRTTINQYEYRCECGHVGWSTHHDILRRPVEGVDIHGPDCVMIENPREVRCVCALNVSEGP